MVPANTVKKVLEAIAAAHPSSGGSLLDRLDVVDGWGDTLIVRLHATVAQHEDGDHQAHRLREAVAEAIGERRRRVEIVWVAER